MTKKLRDLGAILSMTQKKRCKTEVKGGRQKVSNVSRRIFFFFEVV